MDFYETDDDKKKKKSTADEYEKIQVDTSKIDFSKPQADDNYLDLSKVDFSKPITEPRTSGKVKQTHTSVQVQEAPQINMRDRMMQPITTEDGQTLPSVTDQWKQVYGDPVEGLTGQAKVKRLEDAQLNPNASQPVADSNGLIQGFNGMALMDANRFKGLKGGDARIAAQKTYAGFLGFNDEEQNQIVDLAKEIEGGDKFLWFDFNKSQPVEDVQQLLDEGDFVPSGETDFIKYQDKEARTYQLGLVARLSKSENGSFDLVKAKEYWDRLQTANKEESERQQQYQNERRPVIEGIQDYPILSTLWDSIESTFAPLGRNEVEGQVNLYGQRILGESSEVEPQEKIYGGQAAGDQPAYKAETQDTIKKLLSLQNYQQNIKYGAMFGELAKNPDTRWLMSLPPIYYAYNKLATPEQKKEIDKYIPSTLRVGQTIAQMAPMALGNGAIPMFLAMIDSQAKDGSKEDYNSSMMTQTLLMGVGHVAGMAKPIIGSVASTAVQTGAFGTMIGEHYVKNWDKYHNPDGTINWKELAPDIMIDGAMSGLTFGGIKESIDSIKSKRNPIPYQVANIVLQSDGKYAMFVMNPESGILEPKFITETEVAKWKQTQDEAGRQYIIQNIPKEQMSGFVRNGSEGMKEAFTYLLTGTKGEVRNLSDSVLNSKRPDVKSDAGKAILNEDNKLDKVKSNIYLGRNINNLDENREYSALKLLLDYKAPLNINSNLVGGSDSALSTIKNLESKGLVKIDSQGQITTTNIARLALERFNSTIENFSKSIEDGRNKFGEGKELDVSSINKEGEGNELTKISLKDKLYTADDLASMGERKKQAVVLGILKGEGIFDPETGTVKGSNYIAPKVEIQILDIPKDSKRIAPTVEVENTHEIKSGDYNFRNLEDDEIFNPQKSLIVRDENSGRIMTLQKNKRGLYGDDRPSSSINNLSRKTIEDKIRSGEYTFGVPKPKTKVDVGGLEKSTRSMTWEERPESKTPEFKGERYSSLSDEEKTKMENLFAPNESQQKLPLDSSFEVTEKNRADVYNLGKAIKNKEHQETINFLKKILGDEFTENPKKTGEVYAKALEAVNDKPLQSAVNEKYPETKEDHRQNQINYLTRNGEVKVNDTLSIEAGDPEWKSYADMHFVSDPENLSNIIGNNQLVEAFGVLGQANGNSLGLTHTTEWFKKSIDTLTTDYRESLNSEDIRALSDLKKTLEFSKDYSTTITKFDPLHIGYDEFESTVRHENTHKEVINAFNSKLLPDDVIDVLDTPHGKIVQEAILDSGFSLSPDNAVHEVLGYATSEDSLISLGIKTEEQKDAFLNTYADTLEKILKYVGDDVVGTIKGLADPKILEELDNYDKFKATRERLDSAERERQRRVNERSFEKKALEWEGSGLKKIKAQRLTPTGEFDSYTNYPAQETKSRIGGKRTFNFFVSKPDGTFVIEPDFTGKNYKSFNFEGNLNLLDVGKDIAASSDYNNLSFSDFQNKYENQGYDGFYSSREDLPDMYKYRMAVFDNDITRATLSGQDPNILAMRQREFFLNNKKFKYWFGDSIVTDYDGNPRVVYHGTSAKEDFDTFNTESFNDLGSHFGTLGQATKFTGIIYKDNPFGSVYDNGRIFPVYLKIKNPIRVLDLGNHNPENLIPQLIYKKIITREELESKNIFKTKELFNNLEYPSKYTLKSLDSFKTLLEDKGYDGIVYRNQYEDDRAGQDSYIVFRPNQVKSAISNTGLFNEWHPSILQSKAKVSNAGFYSPIEEAAIQADEAGKLPEKASGRDWLNKIKDLAFDDNGVRRGVKQDELDWMGLDEFLTGNSTLQELEDQKGTTFSKKEVLEFIKSNNVAVEEKQYGNVKDSPEVIELKENLAKTQLLYDNAKSAVNSKQTEIYSKNKYKNTNKSVNIDSRLKDAQKELRETIEYKNFDELTKELEYQKSEIKKQSFIEDSTNWSYGNLVLGGKKKNNVEIALSVPDLTKGSTFRTSPERHKGTAYNTYKSPHDFPDNTIVHIRGNERKLVSGENAFHIEEIQSDLHQTGKKEGYGNTITDEDGEYHDPYSGVLDAPFKETKWIELGFKKALRYAVENGFKKITWTTGKQQIDRNESSSRYNANKIEYDQKGILDKNLINLNIIKSDGKRLFAVVPIEGKVEEWKSPFQGFPEYFGKTLDQIIGKKMADEVRANKEGKFEGNLSIGGGLHKFVYDQFLPQFAKKFGKKWGTEVSSEQLVTRNDSPLIVKKVEAFNKIHKEQSGFTWKITDKQGNTIIDAEKYPAFGTEKEANDFVNSVNNGETLHSMTIPDAMRESVADGLPLFNKKLSDSPEVREDRLMRKYYTDPPTVESTTNIIKQGFFSNLSAVKEGMSPEEALKANESLKKDLENNGLKVVDTKGVYNGQPEDSFLVYYPDSDSSKIVQYFSNKYGQESALHGAGGKYWLEFADGSKVTSDKLDLVDNNKSVKKDDNKEDYDKEVKFANEIISGDKNIEDSPDFSEYKDTVDKESKYVAGDTVYLGGGPVPFTPIILAKEGHSTTSIDINKEAVDIGSLVSKKLGADVKTIEGDGATLDYSKYDTVIIALEAGQTLEEKRSILAQIKKTSKNNATVIIRSSNDKNTEGGFVNSSKIIKDYFKVEDKESIFGGLSTSFITKNDNSIPVKEDFIKTEKGGIYIKLPNGEISLNIDFNSGENIPAPQDYNLDSAKLKIKESKNGVPTNRDIQNIEALKTEDGLVTKYDVLDKNDKLVGVSKVDEKGKEYFEKEPKFISRMADKNIERNKIPSKQEFIDEYFGGYNSNIASRSSGYDLSKIESEKIYLIEGKAGEYHKADFHTEGIPTNELLSKLNIQPEGNKPLVDSLSKLEKEQTDFSDIYEQVTREPKDDIKWNKAKERFSFDTNENSDLILQSKQGKKKKDIDIDVSEPLLAKGDFDAWIDVATRFIKDGHLTDGEVDKISTLAASKDIDGLHKFVLGLNKQGVLELLVSFLRVNPLVGVKNILRNTISNELHQVATEIARVPAFILDAGLVKLNDLAKGENTERSILSPSVISQGKGLWKSVTEGLPSSAKFFFHGGDTATFESPTMFRDRTTGWTALKPLEVYTKYGFRLQEAADIPFKTQGYYRALDELTKIKMKSTGLSFEDSREELTISDYDKAFDTALYLSFQDNNIVASTYYKMRDGQSPLVRALMDFTVRYVKTPLNVVSATMDYSGIYPLLKGINNKFSHEDWKGLKNTIQKVLDTPEDREAISWGIGKGIIGWTLGYIGFKLAMNGVIKSFFEKDDKKERELQGAKGLSYGSLEYGGRAYDISSLTPVSFYLLSGAAYAESYKDYQDKLEKAESDEDKERVLKTSPVTQAMSRIIKNLALQTPIISTGIRLYEDNETREKGAIPDFSALLSPSTIVPAVVGEVAKTLDKKERVIDNRTTTTKIGKTIQSMIPVAREAMPAQVDMLGREINAPYGFDPLKTKKIDTDPLVKELSKFDIALIDTTKGTSVERNEAKKEKGQYFEPILRGVINNEDYINSDDKNKKKSIQDVIKYMTPEFKKDKLKPDEEKHNVSVIIKRNKFTSDILSAPQQFSKDRIITDENTLKNASKIGIKQLNVSQMYSDLSNQEGGIADFIKSQFTHNLMVGKNTTKAEAEKNLQEFNQDPELKVIEWYLKEKEYHEREPRLKARREELIKQGKTEKEINAIMAKDRVATGKRNKANKLTQLSVSGLTSSAKKIGSLDPSGGSFNQYAKEDENNLNDISNFNPPPKLESIVKEGVEVNDNVRIEFDGKIDDIINELLPMSKKLDEYYIVKNNINLEAFPEIKTMLDKKDKILKRLKNLPLYLLNPMQKQILQKIVPADFKFSMHKWENQKPSDNVEDIR